MNDGGVTRTFRIVADSNRQARRPLRALVARRLLPALFKWCLKPAKQARVAEPTGAEAP